MDEAVGSKRPFFAFPDLSNFVAGTKITYPRETLLMLQASPHSKSPLNFSAFPGLSKASHAVQVSAEPEVRNVHNFSVLQLRLLAPYLLRTPV